MKKQMAIWGMLLLLLTSFSPCCSEEESDPGCDTTSCSDPCGDDAAAPHCASCSPFFACGSCAASIDEPQRWPGVLILRNAVECLVVDDQPAPSPDTNRLLRPPRLAGKNEMV